MTALLFTIVLFAYWGSVGYATLSLFSPRLRIVQGILLSPAIGISAVILPVFFLNRAGLPVKDFAGYLLPALAGLSALILAVKRPLFPISRLWPFFAILLAAILLAARPMLSYGFDWVSFSNDDMANSALAAARFFNHGYFDVPNLVDLHAGRDYSLEYWFMYAVGGVRPGSELMLAAVWAVTGLNAHQIFMPVIVALHLSLICAAAAIVAGYARGARATLIAAAFMTISPLTTLGLLYQLNGQVGGLALLCAAVTLLYRKQRLTPFPRLVLASVPGALVLAGLFVWYQEALPFLGFGWLVYAILSLKRDPGSAKQIIAPVLSLGLVLLVLPSRYVITALFSLLGHAHAPGVMTSVDLTAVQFPYFLVPSGIPALWGLIPIAGVIREPFVSLAVAAGILLSLWFLPRLLRQAGQLSPSAHMSIAMLAIGGLLFVKNGDYGLFKLSMFLQPFMLGVAAIEIETTSPSFGKWGFTVLAGALSFSLISQFSYVNKSTGDGFGLLNEIPHASALKVNRQFGELFESLRNRSSTTFLSDASSPVIAKFQSLYSRETGLLFPSRNFFRNIVAYGISARQEAEKAFHFISREFVSGEVHNTFEAIAPLYKFDILPLITNARKTGIFNNYQRDNTALDYCHIIEKPRNHLVFVFSELGNHYYLGELKKIAFYQLENDPMFPGREFSGLGRHLLFMVLGTTPRPRVVLDLTTTVVKQFDSELPRPKILGRVNNEVAFVGRGTGRVVSQPLDLMYIDDVPYFSIDMERNGRKFPYTPRGLMLLYGREVSPDRRWLTAFGRDISLISEEEYRSFKAPDHLKNFPADLANKHLEYSGIYEDGWISERAFFVLSPGASSRHFMLKGLIPKIEADDFRTTLTIRIDGKVVATKDLGLGIFDIRLPVEPGSGRHRIDLAFDRYQRLPGRDGRPTGGKIDFIGYADE